MIAKPPPIPPASSSAYVSPNDEAMVEGRAVIPGALVEVITYHWRAPQEVTLTRERSNLDLAMSPRATHAEGTYLASGAAGPTRYGEMIFFPAGYALHSRWNAGRQRSIRCELDFDQLAGIEDLRWAERDLVACCDVRNVFVREAMLRLAREILAPGFASDVLVESLCRAIAVELPRHFGLLRRSEAELTPLGEKQLRRIEERTLSVGTPMPTVSELAADFGMSARHFSRVFRQATGMTVAAFVTQQRIAQAKSFLTDRRVSIKEIAFRAGFQNVSAFSAAFRRETGLSPRRFRYAVFENSLRRG